MRTFLKAIATAIVLTCGVAFSGGANALPLAPLSVAADSASHIDQVQYGCRRVWRCGPYGNCGWRRVCYRPPVQYYAPVYRPYRVYRPYGFYRPYGVYRPYGYGYGWGRRW